MASAIAPVSTHPSVRFARVVLTVAGSFGLLQVLPLYFSEATFNRVSPPPLTHPEFYYGFVGIVVAWQIAFLIMSRDPLRYRPLFPALFVEKSLWPAALLGLYSSGRLTDRTLLATGALDVLWLVLFVVAWVRLGALSRSSTSRASELAPGRLETPKGSAA